ncbi:MAG: glutathione peroxidase [Actinomycetaceae bacterium]|nr:glutathione peroxidase [Actinomycetaceae bacterium]
MSASSSGSCTLRDFHATKVDGTKQPLGAYYGQVVLIVNTASKCGLATQFVALQQLYDRYRDAGFIVLAFPCGQFGDQEEAKSEDDNVPTAIEECRRRWGLTFPIFSPVDVNGDNADPLFTWLRSQTGGILGDAVKWNFTKFLVDRSGRVQGRYAPTTKPQLLLPDIERELAASAY